jgi:SAM-dependent methyltransferase
VQAGPFGDATMEGIGPGELVRRFLSGRSPATARAYAADLEDLARFLGTSIEDAVRSLLLGPESARRRLLEYAVDLRRRGLAPATRRRRLATLRALLGMAREQGMITWAVEPPREGEVELAMTERAERERSSYLFPRHPGEADRLDLQHHALREALGRNFLAPVEAPGRVLDVGTGTGRWGIEVCWEHPEALVVGLDLVAGPREHPSGYRHVRGNLLQGLPFQEGVFDLVHQRLLMSGVPVPSWPAVVGELVRVTRPGGWVELVEPMVSPEPLGPAAERLFGMLLELAAGRGLDTSNTVFRSLDGYLREAGLEQVARHEVTLPIGEWGGRIGSFMASDARALCTRMCELLSARSALSAEEGVELLRRSQEEFERHRTTWTVAVVSGRKPG